MDTRRLNWDDLKIFLQVARTGGLSSGGKILKVDPATAGRRIARLEEQLQVSLFVKSPNGYDLTDAGQRLMARVTQMEQTLLDAQSEITGQGDSLSGSIRIGAPDGSANYLLPQVCAEICDEHPGLDLQIVALPRIINLSKREADMVVTVSPPKAGRQTVQKICDYHLHLAATETYLSSHAPIHSKADLKDHRIIGYIPDLIFDRELDYKHEVGEALIPDLASNSFSVQLNFARNHAGVCIVHDFAIPAVPGLKKILTEEISLKRSFYLVRHRDDRRVSRLNQFAEQLVRKIKREVSKREAET